MSKNHKEIMSDILEILQDNPQRVDEEIEEVAQIIADYILELILDK